MKISVVTYLDHFFTSTRTEICVNSVVGEIIEENDVYLYLKVCHENIYPDNEAITLSDIEKYGVLKAAIITRKDYDLAQYKPEYVETNDNNKALVDKIRKKLS
jgi:hypothetical protein